MPHFVRSLELNPRPEVLQALNAFEAVPGLVLLDSAAHHRLRDSRFTFLTADPVAGCRVTSVTCGDSPFSALRDWQALLRNISTDNSVELPPFCGGIAGLMSYELGHAFERLPSPKTDDFHTPALLAALFDWALVWDHLKGTVHAWVLEIPGLTTERDATRRLQWIQNQLSNPPLPRIHGDRMPVAMPSFSDFFQIEPTSEVYSNFHRDQYLTSVEQVIEYIRAGDIFQANLSQRLLSPWPGTAAELYRRVRRHNPAPFCGLLTFDDVAVISASPERFLRVDRSGGVETRPIKGTRRRPRSPIADLYAGNELTASEKDRAENVMIVDLLRNDISRNCRVGSVRVTGLCEIERFETVLHLVSTVTGQLRDDRDVWDLLQGSFPGGSITGAPKIRAMEIISELEPNVRGAYCGSLFACGPCGDFDSSILIRTFTLRNGWVQFPVGGGIVADSDPLDEYRETLHKASGMLRSLRSL